MDIQEIQDQLNRKLSGSRRKLVFWYDDDGSYEEEVDHLQLAEGNKLWKLTGRNYFATKLLIEEQDPESGYLIYAPFPRPADKENSLADMFYYAEHFYSDKLLQLMGELKIPGECEEQVKKYKKFWTSGNTARFRALEIQEYTPETIDLGIICALAGVKTLRFEEALRRIVLAGTKDNVVFKKLVNQKIQGVFWQLCRKNYGYEDENPTLEKFLRSMVVTYIDAQMAGNEPEEWKKFRASKQNDAFIFVKNLMGNEESRAFYDSLAERTARELDVKGVLLHIPLPRVLACDAFSEFDENLIDWMISKIEDHMLDERIDGLSIPEICKLRMETGYHFSDAYREKYQMMYYAYEAIRQVSLHTVQTSVREEVEAYGAKTYWIDTCYRKFYYYLDRVGMSENVEKIRDLVENMYTNRYLAHVTCHWNQLLSDQAYRTYAGAKEENFFYSYVEPFMREGGKEGRVVVIISDGLRYECGRELMDNLELDEKCDGSLDLMLGVLPSETTLGMAALLPHEEIRVDENLNIYADGLPCGNSLLERQRILQRTVPRSACYDFDRVRNAKQAEVRQMFQDKDLVYIYQNQIDSRGEGQRSENEVFHACQEAMGEIQEMIRRLTGYISNTRYLVTGDHGFIYKREKLEESDKIAVDALHPGYKNKRFLLSKSPIQSDALTSRSLAYLGKSNETYVTTPLGADIMKMPGGGQNYVHGGSSLQEMAIPVLKITTFKGKQETDFVNVELSTFNHRVTDIQIKLDFMQMEPVTDTVKPRRLLAFFVDGDGHKISFDVPITANRKDPDPKKRLFTEKFTLKSGRYVRGQEYFLVLADQDQETKELRRYKFEIDISEESELYFES